MEQPELSSERAGSDAEGGTETEEVDATSEEMGGTYLPVFLSDSPIGGDRYINVKMAHTIQANKQFKKHCFQCNSPDHFIRTALRQKMVKGPKR